MSHRKLAAACLPILLMAISLSMTGCVTSSGKDASVEQNVPDNLLRIGISPDYPPIAFLQNNKPVGVDVDLADRLGQELDRPVELVDLQWDKQIDALLDGEIDIIMSGMTITDARKVRIDFADPYMEIGLMALVRIKDQKKFKSANDVLKSHSRFGVQEASTSEVFVRKKCADAINVTCLDPDQAAYYLSTRRIDIYIYDGPGIIWLASENENELAFVPCLLNKEQVAWGVRKTDNEFRRKINSVLASWKRDGTLDKVIGRWLPFFNKTR